MDSGSLWCVVEGLEQKMLLWRNPESQTATNHEQLIVEVVILLTPGANLPEVESDLWGGSDSTKIAAP